MKFASWSVPALIVLAEAGHVSAKSIFTPQLLRRDNDYNEIMERAALNMDNGLEKRSPDSTSSTAPAQSSGVLSVGTPSTENNSNITSACSQAMSNMTTLTNGAGFAGCYNILDWNPTTSQFQADLRIYSTGHETGDFANVAENMILVLLKFPSSTVFKSLTKRSTSELERRQNGMTQIQQYSLQGGFSAPLDMSKLNDTQKASLMVPQITLQATNNGSTFSSNMTSTDLAFFATGQFTQLAAMAAQVADPKTASAAITVSKVFVLPGTRFGIFPIGLIVTSAWTFMFLLAYGAGTIARFRYRSMYRKRVAATSGRSKYAPGIGKF